MSYATDAVKHLLTARDVAARYGMAVDRSGWTRCPLHPDHRPSLRLYDGDKGWHCFQCGAGGTAIDLTMALYGINCDQAVVRLNHDFCLGIPLGRKPTMRERASAESRAASLRALRESAEQEAKNAEAAYWAAFAHWLRLARWSAWYRPTAPADNFNLLWAYAQQHLPEAYDTAQRANDERVTAWNKYNQMCATWCQTGAMRTT